MIALNYLTLPLLVAGAMAVAAVAPAQAAKKTAEKNATEVSTAFTVWAQTSLQRIFPLSEVGTTTSHHLTAVKNQQLSFQIGIRNNTQHVVPVGVTATETGELKARVRRVGYVPMHHHTGETRKEELDGIGHLPGMVPDPLFNETTGTIGSWENIAFWVTVAVPQNCSAGLHTMTFTVKPGDDPASTITATVKVRDLTLQARENFPVTHWWRPDAIFNKYGYEPFSDDFFAMVKKYMRNMVEHGNNVMFVPTLENRREDFTRPMQMLLISKDGERWNFDFRHVRRLIRIGKELGFEYYEFPHIWLYWGVKHAAPVYLTTNGKYERVWGQNADGFSPEFLEFLKQYLDALHAFLQEENILENSFHHLSDEPEAGGPEAIVRYERARSILHDYAPWMDGKVLDALADIDYAKKGITDIPVALINTAKEYADTGLHHWAYYACLPMGDYLNRFMDTPLTKIRMSGFLFYKLKARGFLHWGYNYWYKLETDTLLDPFCRGDAGFWPGIPYGDPFVVYPGTDGPLDSIRWEIFAEALQDYALLQMAGIEPEAALLESVKDYDDFPKTEEWLNKTLLEVFEAADKQQ